jgi:hypothetical protein
MAGYRGEATLSRTLMYEAAVVILTRLKRASSLKDWGCPYRKSRSSWRIAANRAMLAPMGDILKLIWWIVIGSFRSRASLEAEFLTLRHQLNVLRRKSPKRLVFSNFDRLVFAGLYRIVPRIVNALVIVQPETVIRWHRLRT